MSCQRQSVAREALPVDRPILRLDPQSLPQPHILPAGVAHPADGAAARVSLEITRGRVQQRVRPIAGKIFLIGAASDCDLVLGDLQFPEAYAYVFVSGSRVSIRRLGAGPELLVCGEPVESGELFHGDLLELGPFELRVRIDEAPRGSQHDDDGSGSSSTALRANAEQAGAIHEVRMLLVEVRRAFADESPVLRLYHEVAESHESESRTRRVSA
jgi:hypothetical protein